MASFGTWFKRAVQQVWDPTREERIQEIASELLKGLQKNRDSFSLHDHANRVECSKAEFEVACHFAYEQLLTRAWRDGKVTTAEHQTLRWAAKSLAIPGKKAADMEHQFAQHQFAAVLARAMNDGIIDDQEAYHLEAIARSVGSSVGAFVTKCFQSEGEEFLRNAFATCTEGGMLGDDAWGRLIKTSERLGISATSLSVAIRPQALRFIEHLFADAKSDGEFSEEEEKQLLDLIQKLGISPDSRGYLDRSILALRTIRRARDGRLPVVERPAGVTIRAGEIVHLHVRATWRQRRILKSGDTWDEHKGSITITDNRLLFSSDTKSYDVRFVKIVAHQGETGKIRLQRMEKPECVIRVIEDEPIAYAILEGAIALATQTRLAKQDDAPSRYISREVRQRVWQKFGGQCAECGDGQYLEFDHIIPVAKGGSNSDANVQLLCRKCNLKKSDRI